MSNAKTRKPKKRTPPPVTVNPPKPWALIISTVAVVLFAAGVIGYAIYENSNDPSNEPSDLAEQAAGIEGVAVQQFESGRHVEGTVDYQASPPFGGEHNSVWADCTGTVYENPIPNENAVHSLEHGAVWIAYSPDLTGDEIGTLEDKVDGHDHMLMSPYPGLEGKVSLQAWGFQLFVDSVDDPRIDEFIRALRVNPVTTPEDNGTCVNTEFRDDPPQPQTAQ